jgi:hypothetical protein
LPQSHTTTVSIVEQRHVGLKVLKILVIPAYLRGQFHGAGY